MKSYKKTVLNVEHFTPNEFVAACHDENTVYKFVCDAGGGEKGTVWVDSDKNGYFNPIKDECLTGALGILNYYHACGKTHEAPTDDVFLDGFYFENTLSWPKKVKIWTDGGTDIHCTTNLEMDTWETAKS